MDSGPHPSRLNLTRAAAPTTSTSTTWPAPSCASVMVDLAARARYRYRRWSARHGHRRRHPRRRSGPFHPAERQPRRDRTVRRITVAGAEPSDDAVNVDGADGNDTLTPVTSASPGRSSSGSMAETAPTAPPLPAARRRTPSPLRPTARRRHVRARSLDPADDRRGGPVGERRRRQRHIDAGNGLAPLTNLTINGGNGDDSLIGGDGDDTVIGGPGNDSSPAGGATTWRWAMAPTTFIWNPGMERHRRGPERQRSFLFGGANVNENVSLSATAAGSASPAMSATSSGPARYRDHASWTCGVAPTGDRQRPDRHRYSRTRRRSRRHPGTGIGDGQLDTVIVNGTPGPDHVSAPPWVAAKRWSTASIPGSTSSAASPAATPWPSIRSVAPTA